MRILFTLLTLVQWSIYTLGGVVFIKPELNPEQATCIIITSCSEESQSCSGDTADCQEQEEQGCCDDDICLTICCPLQTGPVQETLQAPHGIDLIAGKHTAYLAWYPNPYLETFSPPPDQFHYCS
jgi:hypothetical protein